METGGLFIHSFIQPLIQLMVAEQPASPAPPLGARQGACVSWVWPMVE